MNIEHLLPFLPYLISSDESRPRDTSIADKAVKDYNDRLEERLRNARDRKMKMQNDQIEQQETPNA